MLTSALLFITSLINTQAIESVALMETPLFLRFINMIVNDATIQLDEGLEVFDGYGMFVSIIYTFS